MLLSPNQELSGREPLCGLRGVAVDLPDNDVAVGMHVDAQFDGFGLGACDGS
jgi:hypothetical protein